MKISSQIDQLITEDIVGIISAEDKVYLYQMMATHPEIGERYEYKKSIIANEVTMARLSQATEFRDPELLKAPGRSRRKLLAISIAAAIIILVGTFILFQSKTSVSPDQGPSKKVELVLASGKRLDLTGSDIHQSINGKNITSRQKTLSYSLEEKASSEQATLLVPAGKEYSIVLSDGTKIHLNSTSRIRFPFTFSEHSREITFDGEGYFEIANDPARPFLVRTPTQIIQVLGTAFNINTYDNTSETVSLMNGSVKVKTEKDSLILEPGIASRSAQNGKLTSSPFDSEDVLSWREGIFEFYDTPLQKVIEVLPRWFGEEVIIDQPTAANIRFSGYIDRNKPLTAFLIQLQATNGITFYQQDGTYHIR